MTRWTPAVDARDGTLYEAIVDALAADIRDGRLAPGDRLPTQRTLAAELDVALGTVTRAYTEARRRGLIEGAVGRGTFVREPTGRATQWALDAAPDRSVVDLGLLVPPPLGEERAAEVVDALGRGRDAEELESLLGYVPHGGLPAHRRAGAAWIGRTGLDASAEDVLVCASAQHAMVVALGVVARPGDVVLTEWLTSPGIRDLASWKQVRLHGLPMDDHGLLPSAFDAACRLGIGRVLYTMPVLHNPTTVSMPEERRREIAGIAREHGVAVVEDGVHGLLAGDGIPPLTAFAPQAGYYLTSLSKTIAPGLRVGYLRAPRAAIDRLEGALRATLWMASPLLADVAARWISDGTADAIVGERRAEARARQAAATARLGALRYRAAPSGFHGWLPVPPEWGTAGFVEAARRAGVALNPAEVFVAGRGHAPSRVRLCLGSAAARADVERGLEVVRDLLIAGPEGAAGGGAEESVG